MLNGDQEGMMLNAKSYILKAAQPQHDIKLKIIIWWYMISSSYLQYHAKNFTKRSDKSTVICLD